MSRPFVKGEAHEIVVNSGDERLQRIGKKLMRQLWQQLDPGGATAVLYIALTEAMIGILHIESPMPEVNIAAMQELIDTLRANVKQHEDCAIHLSESIKFAQALENGDMEPPEIADKVTVH